MAIKRFRSARYWHNTFVMLWGVPFIVLPGIIVTATSGNFTLLWCLLSLCAIGSVMALVRDGKKSFIYELDDDRLTIVQGAFRKEFAMTDIADATLLDRAAAREYLREQVEGYGSGGDRGALAASFQRFCSVDVGFVSYTLGLGRILIDRLPDAKYDLVLLRSREEGAFVLSPVHAQSFVEVLNRRKLR